MSCFICFKSFLVSFNSFFISLLIKFSFPLAFSVPLWGFHPFFDFIPFFINCLFLLSFPSVCLPSILLFHNICLPFFYIFPFSSFYSLLFFLYTIFIHYSLTLFIFSIFYIFLSLIGYLEAQHFHELAVFVLSASSDVT